MNTKLPKALSQGEEAFLIAWKAMGGTEPVREYKFHQERDWRFDFAWPHKILPYSSFNFLELKIAVEVEGGTRRKSRHTSHAGFVGDCEKYNEATRMGWRVFRLTPDMIDEDHLKPIMELML